jgi:hypothetical protein
MLRKETVLDEMLETVPSSCANHNTGEQSKQDDVLRRPSFFFSITLRHRPIGAAQGRATEATRKYPGGGVIV